MKPVKTICIALFCTFLAGCELDLSFLKEKPAPVVKAPEYKLPVVGIDFTTADKKKISKAFSDANIPFIQSINKWEEQWESGDLFPGSTSIRLGYTEQHLLAYFQFDFQEPSTETTAQLLETLQARYSTPTGVEGDIATGGEYTANWDMGDGTRVQLKREYPKRTNHVTYFNDPLFDTLKLEFSIAARKAVEFEKEQAAKFFR